MTKFNVKDTRSSARSPITTTGQAVNHEGAAGYTRDLKSELFLLAVGATDITADTFYERGDTTVGITSAARAALHRQHTRQLGPVPYAGAADSRVTRFRHLVREVAVTDPEWTAGFLGWLRGEGNLRTASLVGAIEAARAMVTAGIPGGRAVVASVLQRPDEPGEALAYHLSRYGRKLPKPIKRGIADAVVRLYNERALLKYDTASHGVRFGDVLDLTHPEPAAPWQGALFGYALDRRHGRDSEASPELEMILRNAELRHNAAQDPAYLLDPGRLRLAGMTWEDVLSLAGNRVDKAQLWEALIPTMGYMALLRNLRNLDDAGIREEVADVVIRRIKDPEQVAKSRQFPFRFYAAYLATAGSLRWGYALEKALNHSLANIPALSGGTLVLVDQSPSMWPGYGMKMVRSDMTNADLAKLFGTAVAVRAERADLVQYGGSSAAVPFRKGDAVLRVMERFRQIGATDTVGAVARHYSHHDRIVIVTDEQNQFSRYGRIDDHVPASVPVYVWNIGGYAVGSTASGPNRHTFAGMTDHAFRMVPLLERGRDGAWPWIQTEAARTESVRA